MVNIRVTRDGLGLYTIDVHGEVAQEVAQAVKELNKELYIEKETSQ